METAFSSDQKLDLDRTLVDRSCLKIGIMLMNKSMKLISNRFITWYNVRFFDCEFHVFTEKHNMADFH